MSHAPIRLLLVALIALVALVPATAAKKPGKPDKSKLQQKIALPNGFQPEGIASTGGKNLYVGSIPTGAVRLLNARTGNSRELVPPHADRNTIGIKVKRGLIFAAGGLTGDAWVYNAKTGADVMKYDLAPDGANTFVNDVVVTGKAAYFTDSRLQQLYVLPFGDDGALPSQADVQTLPLTGDIAYTTGNNANGIATRGGALIIVQGNAGKLFKVNPATGVTDEIELTGLDGNVLRGDGLLRRGNRLYVVQNTLNKIAVVRLGEGTRSGVITRYLEDPDFDVPTTIAWASGRLFAANARFTTTPGPDVPYWVNRVG